MRAQTKGKHGMGKRFALVVAAVLAMIVSVVGWATAGTVGAQTPSCLPTSDRMPGPRAFGGVGIKRRAPVYTDALQYAQFLLGRFVDPNVVHEADALTSEGFVSGIRQGYSRRKHHRVDAGGHATTVQLGSPEQAQAELNRHLASSQRFTVSAIPGSRGGADARIDQGSIDIDIDLGFTDGDYSYLIERFDSTQPQPGVTKRMRALRVTRQVTNAAINLYNRVHGAAVCP